MDLAGAATNDRVGRPLGRELHREPDARQGDRLGDWTEEMFIATMRTGRHQGKGRPMLPPMPYFGCSAALNDEDIKALFAYLQSLPPVHNRVPAPIDPPEEDGQ